MKIDSKILASYITKASINNESHNLQLNFTEEGLTSKIMITNTAMADCILTPDEFEDYEALGEMWVKNSKVICDMIKTFDGQVEIEKVDDFMIKLKTASREFYNTLAEKSVCDNVVETMPTIPETILTATLSKSDMTPLLGDMKNLNMSIVRIKSNENDTQVNFQIGLEDETDYTQNYFNCETTADVKVGIGHFFKPIVECLSGDFTFKVTSNGLIIFEEKTDNMSIRFIVAPHIENED